MNNNVLILKEHGLFQFEMNSKERTDLLALLSKDDYDPAKPDKLLGLDWNNRSQTVLQSRYFIGLKWIKEGESAIYVKPKIANLDFMSIFMSCFNNECRDVAAKLGKIYCIDFDKKPINVTTEFIELTPILIVHFLKLAQSIVQKGIKYNYILRVDNLNGKIKGKVMINQTLNRNYSSGRIDRTICQYQDYSIDCFENRILKKALLFVNKFIDMHPDINSYKDIKQMTTYCLGAMSSVGDQVPLRQMKQFKVNPLYKEYTEALKVAKLILRRFSYNIELVKKDMDRALPPFWIDMSLLFELYVYSQLKKAYGCQIHHKLRTYGNEIDFVKYDERLIVDAKYIPRWEDSINHDNVRQLSGYARNTYLREEILKKAKDETTILDCLIIYPGLKNCVQLSANEKLINDKTSIGTYLKFHKIAIKLPLKSNDNSVYVEREI